MANDGRPPDDPDALQGANSLEGSLADHLAYCAKALLERGQIGEATFALAEARRAQVGMLRQNIESASAPAGLAPASADGQTS